MHKKNVEKIQLRMSSEKIGFFYNRYLKNFSQKKEKKLLFSHFLIIFVY